jgi:Zn-dependent protease
MFRSFRLGRLFGFPIEVNTTFLIMLGVVLLWMGGLPGLFVVGLAFASVLLHELGHAVVARSLGVGVSGIELHFFGGAAKMMEQPRSARDEILIALAGPAVSFALAGVGWLGFAATGASIFYLLGWINTVIGVFNLIPAMPMDGGRVLRAALTRRFSFFKATDLAVKVARVFAVGLGVYGLASGQLYLILVAVVIWLMGTAELNAARMFGYRDGAARPEVMRRGNNPLVPFFVDDMERRAPRRVVVHRRGNQIMVEVVDG